MRTALLFLTGLATAYQLFGQVVMVVCGRAGFDLRLFKLIPFTGAILLIVAAFIPEKKKSGLWLAAAGCAVLWLYFVPGLGSYLIAISQGRDYFDWLLFIPAILLAGSSVYVVLSFLHRPAGDTGGTSSTAQPPPIEK